MKGSNKQPDKKKKSEKQGNESSQAEYEENGFSDQQVDMNEGTVTAPKGYVSPGRKGEPKEAAGEKGRDSQMKGHETADMPREPEQMKEYTGGERSQYLVTLPHTPGDCQKLHEAIEAQGRGFSGKWEWGCASGNHTGFALVEARNEDEALDLVPEAFRDSARAVRVKKFTLEEVSSLRGKR